jgi:predicted membrane protein
MKYLAMVSVWVWIWAIFGLNPSLINLTLVKFLIMRSKQVAASLYMVSQFGFWRQIISLLVLLRWLHVMLFYLFCLLFVLSKRISHDRPLIVICEKYNYVTIKQYSDARIQQYNNTAINNDTKIEYFEYPWLRLFAWYWQSRKTTRTTERRNKGELQEVAMLFLQA